MGKICIQQLLGNIIQSISQPHISQISSFCNFSRTCDMSLTVLFYVHSYVVSMQLLKYVHFLKFRPQPQITLLRLSLTLALTMWEDEGKFISN